MVVNIALTGALMAEAPPRLTPDQLIIMKLFEIADRLAEVAPPVGIIRSFGARIADNMDKQDTTPVLIKMTPAEESTCGLKVFLSSLRA